MYRSIVHFYYYNLLAYAFGGSNPPLPTRKAAVGAARPLVSRILLEMMKLE